jgi:metal-sulfur cluster biosynthetic enzyme
MWNAIKDHLSGDDASDDASSEEMPIDWDPADVPLQTTSSAPLLEALRDVVDPELGINIVDLGLVYALEPVDGKLHVAVTATTPACPLSGVITQQIEEALGTADEASQPVEVHLVWEPTWTPEFMNDSARESLGDAPSLG